MVDEILSVKPARTQSPSSILMFKQCPRKYYYRYIAKLPTKTSIHLIRGNIAHKVLEDIYDIDVSVIPEETFPITLRVILQEMLRKEWEANQEKLSSLGLTEDEINIYYEETKIMVNNFYHYLMDRMQQQDMTLKEAFKHVTPIRELRLQSIDKGVMGFADVVQKENGKTVILDYKTSKRAEISEEYHLQLSIYSLLYGEFEKVPDEVGILFLKHGKEIRLPVSEEMVKKADLEVRFIHENTQSKNIDDYSKKPGPLCKWSTGQCDYYDLCFGKNLSDYDGISPEDLVQIGKDS